MNRTHTILISLVLVAIGAGLSRNVPGAMGGMGMMMHGNMMQHRSRSSSDAGTDNTSADNKISGVYTANCAMCHANGLAGAPVFGDSKAWASRISQGRQTLYGHALHGYRGMPPKGGHLDLSDDQVRAVVDYMVEAGGGWGGNQSSAPD